MPSGRFSVAVTGSGALGVLDLGVGDRHAREELALATRQASGPFGIRIGRGCPVTHADLVAELGDRVSAIGTVVLDSDSPGQVAQWPGEYRVLVEVTSLDEARGAVRGGAHGLIARGNEAGGRVSELSSYVLLQQLLADDRPGVPVWVCGGIGPHTAAAAITGGAAGVVLDTQLALLPEADLRADLAAAIAASDGTDTTIIDGERVLARRESADLLPVGQDAFLANRFAKAYGTVARSVAAVRSAIFDALAADAPAVLDEGSPLARALGTALPVVQGPMTRVSDRPDFAARVAEHGALPFLALALSSGEQTRTLLERTRDELGERPWGVGVLGFAPEELRAAQLEVIREVRPKVALIAGGHPGQARSLEDAGISTFLHVASPGLLEQFLDAGTRKFVFEGGECGGHVGPRSSFSLWECQLGVLLDYLDAGGSAAELQVLFAGGVHDERSAAMVAALAQPLARRGAAIGVLMGTAYLFTEEAVRHGAVQDTFQRQALSAEATALLETAPGHATRCVPSPFVDSFGSIKESLAAQGVPKREIWEELEGLNVGRLRIASKGVRRSGDELAPVAAAEQLSEGLFMAGQVAVLRSQVTTVAQLHDGVTRGATQFRAARSRALRAELGITPPPAERVPAPADVAIIGIACMYPGAADLPSFWANVVGNVDSVTEVPAQRWDPAVYYGEGAGRTTGDRTPSKWGGFLPEIAFDPMRYGIPPATLAAVEPVQLLALEAAQRALTDAGLENGRFDRSRTSVVFGAEAGSEYADATTMRMLLPSYLEQVPDELADQLPKLTEDSFPGRLANVIAGRIANRLDLGGSNFTVDAACGSSLAALDLACKELVGGTSDTVLCGAADLHNAISDYLLFSSVGALSATGRSRTFDASADGTVLGEGVACLVLKRLADAERDGDRIYGVVKGVGSASDGKSLGLTAPRPDGQRRAMERAYRQARISPADVGLVEAHGTGTVVGDRTELDTLHAVFTESGATPGSTALGSVKSQIGHTKCAAGLAGLIKTVLALHSGVKPPTLHVAAPNAAWRDDASPFVFNDRPVPWAQAPQDRIAGVSAFGFGGTNFHAVLRGHASAEASARDLAVWPAELFTFRGIDHAGARDDVQRLLSHLETNDAHGRPWRLRDLARTAALRADRGRGSVQVAVLAGDLDELATLLRAALETPVDAGAQSPTEPVRGLFVRGAEQPADPGRLALLFPGQGSQRPHMLAELFVAFPQLQRFTRLAGLASSVTSAMFPPAAFGPDAHQRQGERLRDTRMAQPALGVTDLAANHLFGNAGVAPDMLAGHSYGELVALAASGAVDAETLLAISAGRADAILAAAGDDPGGMAAVAADRADVQRVLDEAGLADTVVAANHNAPRQLVISGPTADLARAMDALSSAGLAAKQLPVACAFHSPVVSAAGDAFADLLAEHRVGSPQVPVWSNRSAAPYPSDPDAVRAELAGQIGSPVRFVEQIEAMYAGGARVFVEAGPGQVLGGLVDSILGERPHVTVSCEGPGRNGLRGFLAALARLSVIGVDVRTAWLTGGRDAVDVAQAVAPPRPGWTIDGQLVRTVDGNTLPGGYAPPRRITLAAAATTPPGTERDAVVSEFLRTSRELVATQRDVLLSYLGGPAPPAAGPPATGSPIEMAPEPVVAPAVVEASPPAPSGPVDADPLQVVLEVIAARTGYPAEMIEPELDLEADLSVDSIKRTEVAGELCARLGVDSGDERFGALVRARTARAMADVIGPPAAGAVTEPPPGGEPPRREPAVESPDPARVRVEPPGRYVLEHVTAEGGEPQVLAGRHVVVFGGDAEVAEALATALWAHDTRVSFARDDDELGDSLDGLVYLDALRADDESLVPDAVRVFRSAMRRSPRWLLAAAPTVPPFDRAMPAIGFAGLRGLFRAFSLEYPDAVTTLVELPPGSSASTIATALVEELLASSPEPVVVAGEQRTAFRMRPSDLGRLAATGAGPAGDGSSEAAAIGLTSESVVLLVGGARGITAKFATALALSSKCRIELAGRTVPATAPERPETAAARDRAGLRTALAGLGVEVSKIDREAREILARREVADTLDQLRRHGAEANYRSVDVRDVEAFRQLIKQVHTEHGRIDGVVYAAGVIDDRLLADKDDASFDRVFGTKVDGARALFAELDALPDRPGFVVLFGSIAAAVGNRGQTDYAAANDALETLGAEWATRTGNRALTVHWGPWAPDEMHGGMVSAELGRDYARRGVAMLDPVEGVASLLRELAWGPPELRSVVYSAPAPWTEHLDG
ncbi:MAG TPA: SDR family NAD(P)-dependent oxidoreductase [Jatrophihabitantaceae bacterium]